MARRTLAGVVGLAAVVALAACVDREPQAPVRPEFGVLSGPGTEPVDCDFSNITSLVIAYFPGPRQNTVKDIVTAMDNAADFSATARDRAFDIMTHIDTVVTAGTAGDPVTGSALVNALIYCMYDPNVPAEVAHRPATFPEDFTVELDPDLHGAFGVRGGATDPLSDAVLSRPLATAYSGVAPGGLSPNWVTTVIDSATPERVLVYGRPVPDEPDHYEWKTLPHNATFDPAVIVGFCLEDFEFPTSMVEMSPGGVLAFQAAEFLPASCSSTALRQRAWEGTLAGLARFGAELFGPRPLWATIVSPGGLGGSTGGIKSKFKPRDLQNTGGVTLTFTQEPPANVLVNQTFTVRVQATTGTTPVTGVSVKLGAFNNNGTPVILSAVQNPVVTDPFGLATFTLSLNKTGAYVLRTTSESTVLGRSTITITPAVSRKFNVKPSK